MSLSAYLAVPLMLVLAILQSAVLPRFPVFGIVLQLPLLFVVACFMRRGINEAVWWAFIGGLCMDLFSVGPVGATALTFIGTVLICSGIEATLPRNTYLLPVLLAFVATLSSFALYWVIVRLFGRPVTMLSFTSLLPVALFHAVSILPIYGLLGLFNRALRPMPATAR